MNDFFILAVALSGLMSLIDLSIGNNTDIEYIQNSLWILLSISYVYPYLSS